MKIKINVDYAAKRKDAYPNVGDQLDAIWKQLAMTPEILSPETQAMLGQVQAVKTAIPKPKQEI